MIKWDNKAHKIKTNLVSVIEHRLKMWKYELMRDYNEEI